MSGGFPPLHYATYFDRHYISRGVALYRSLERHSPRFVLWVLCLDDETHQTMSRLELERVRLVRLAALEEADSDLLAVKPARLPIEYFWTCGPAWLAYLFDHEAQIEWLVYVDADLFFFDSPQPLRAELACRSILLVETRGTKAPDDPRPKQRFNVGLLMFRRTPNGVACVRLWREQCLEWCTDRFEDGRFGDQAYLDGWPYRFSDVAVAAHRGAGVAPWNVADTELAYAGGRILADGDPLIFYHFSKLRRRSRFLYELHDWRFQRQRLPTVLRERVYAPYVRAVSAAETEIRRAGGAVCGTDVGRDPAQQTARRRLALTDRLPFFVRARRFMPVCGRFTL